MQRKLRDTTIFSLSALDLFCSAMGVFMVLCFIVFPYYQNDTPTPPAPAPAPAPAPVPAPAPAPAPRPVVQKEVIAGLTIALKWEITLSDGGTVSMNDVDLHVDAPKPGGGRLHYYYKKPKFSCSPAQLVTDSMNGGNEVWVHPSATPGEYKVSYLFYSFHGGRVLDGRQIVLKLIVMYGDGKTKNFAKTLPYPFRVDTEKQYPWLKINVKGDGDISITEL